MIVPGSANSLLLRSAGVTAYQVERSLRFNSSDSAYLSRTPASAGNRKTFTISLWVKRCKLGVLQSFISSANDTIFLFDANNKLCLYYGPGYVRVSTQVFRDVSAWYHLVLVVDTPNTTAQNRVRMYVNNSEITVWDTNGTVNQNSDTTWNAAFTHQIGANNTTQFADQYIADFYNIDGQALDPTSFAETNITTGQWVPKAYTGTYGTNGFRLAFADNSNNTATTLGKDSSPNGNNWTPNNLSVTAGAGNDSLVDTPTSYGTDTGAGGQVRGNYCTLNPIRVAAGLTISNGNLDVVHGSATSTADNAAVGTISVSNGKWYWEALVTALNVGNIGIISVNERLTTAYLGSTAGSYAWFSNSAGSSQKYNNNVGAAYGTAYAVNVIIGVALDLDNGTLTFYRNGVSQGTAYTSITGTFAPASSGSATNTASFTYNFGQRPFAYTAPSGFKALCDTNLPAPVVAKPNTAFDVALWTGNGSARSITGLNFNPDFVWIKGRSGATDHALYDVVRGTEKRLESNTTDAEVTSDGGVTAFNSDGFSLGTLAQVNTNSSTYVGWAWDGGTSTVTNTQGSITSQVRANASAGFSIVTYTGTGANGTVGHGLNVAPAMVIVKRRDSTGNWQVRHTSIVAASSIQLNLTNAATSATTVWNSTSPTSTVFSIGTDATVNTSSATYVAYCFAPVAGYSSFGSYTGNGSADGPFVYTGFRPALVIVKMSSSTGNWTILDYQRKGYNVDNDPLFPNLSDAEGTTDLIDLTSNGFKVRTTDATFNTNAGTYVYAAFAENPFQYARAR